MHIVFFLPNINSYLDRVNTLKALSCHGNKVTLILGSHDTNIDFQTSEDLKVINAKFISGQKPLNLLKAYRVVHRINKDDPIDIVHDTFGNLILYFLLNFMKSKRPIFLTSFYALDRWRINEVWNSYGYNFFDLLKTSSNRRMLAGSFIQSILVKICDYVVLQAPGLISRFETYYLDQSSKIKLIPNSVDTDFWNSKNRIDFAKTEPVKLLYVGRFDFTSAFKEILLALKELKDKFPTRLTIVGKAGSLDNGLVKKMIEEFDLCDHIDFKDSLDRKGILKIYQSNHILIYQTINDGSPRVVLEAISSGLPVIASHHPGIDVLDPKGEYISFTEFGNTSQIIDQVATMVNSKSMLEKASSNGRKNMIKGFGINKISQIYKQVYGDVTK